MSKTLSKKLLLLLWVVFAVPANALIHASVADRLWTWFLAYHYGPGPALGEWFGVSALVIMFTRHLSHRDEELTDMGEIVGASLRGWIFLGLLLLLALGVGTMFGWIR